MRTPIVPPKREIPAAPPRRVPEVIKRSVPKVLPRILPRPPLPALAPQPDPISQAPEGEPVDKACARELSEMDLAFREMRKAEAAQAKIANDPRYYFVVVFENGAQADSFIEQAGMKGEPDLFMDGRALADRLGFTLPKVEKQPPYKQRIDKRYAGMVGTLKPSERTEK